MSKKKKKNNLDYFFGTQKVGIVIFDGSKFNPFGYLLKECGADAERILTFCRVYWKQSGEKYYLPAELWNEIEQYWQIEREKLLAKDDCEFLRVNADAQKYWDTINFYCSTEDLNTRYQIINEQYQVREKLDFLWVYYLRKFSEDWYKKEHIAEWRKKQFNSEINVINQAYQKWKSQCYQFLSTYENCRKIKGNCRQQSEEILRWQDKKSTVFSAYIIYFFWFCFSLKLFIQ